jgi:Coenzyme PQQ synthesis protein D (PqqD)
VPDMMNLFRNGRLRKAPKQLGPDHLGFRVAPDVKASLHPDGVVLIHLGTGTVFSANRVGAMIWNAAAERWSLDRVAASISSEFHIPAQRVQQDAAEFLAQLAAEGLLVSEES